MKLLHVEASTYCNARCPLCPRSLYGYKVEGVYPEIHLTLHKLKKCIDQFPDLEHVYFNGNLGDPMMNPDILTLATATKCQTSITTNGSIGTKDTWQSLARNDVTVMFSIDGLEDTNHLYRQDVQWSKIMERVKWFIDSGGNAKWKWVPFKHNRHQQDEARKLSEQLGFISFEVQDHGRNYGPALNNKGEVTHWILPADGSREPGNYDVRAGVERYKQSHQNFIAEEKFYEIDCEHEREQGIYLDARGRVSPCCYQGFDLPEVPFLDLKDFNLVKKSWKTKNCNSICAMSCGR